MMQSKIFTCNLQHLKVVNTLKKLNTRSIPTCDPDIPKICLAKKQMFGNRLSWLYHQTNGLTYTTKLQITSWIKQFPNKKCTQRFSIDALTPKMLLPLIKSLHPTTNPSIVITHVWTIWFNNTSKTIVRKGIITFASYLETRQIQSPCPT